jgi:hydrogenase maturation protease
MIMEKVRMKGRTVVMGIGNPLLMDDRAGIEVAERLEAMGVPADYEILYTVGFDVIDKLIGYERAYVIDASKVGKEPGTILEVGVDDLFTTASVACSHAVTLGTTLKTGYMIYPDEMPARLHIILIEADEITEFSRDCSPKVRLAIDCVVERIRLELQ